MKASEGGHRPQPAGDARLNNFTLHAAIGSDPCWPGLLGALTGLGGGVVIVPLLVLVFGVDMRYADRAPR